ncbi:MAG: hypothetical protein H6995_04080 [Pseudomonadales bacterium]|nr:hypothetical protein [Pseudomonadales bacterium]MCP5214170.1 hypothetical protein [Pseudomonadales bacterium]MCP5302637.1 hypothetical protein [Pseudomonadales bacterium]
MIRQKLHSYVILLGNVLLDIRRLYLKSFLSIVLTSILSVALQIVGFWLSLRYFAYAHQEGIGHLFVVLFGVDNYLYEVSVVALILGLTLGFASWLGYLSRILSIHVSTKYEKLCFVRAIKFLNAKSIIEELPYKESEFFNIVNINSRVAGRAIKILITSVQPVFMFITCICIALLIDSVVTVIILFFLGIALPIIYKFNQRGIAAAGELEKNNILANKEKKEVIANLFSIKEELVEPSLESYSKSLIIFKERLKSIEKSRSTMQGFVALSFAFLILYIGLRLKENEFQFILLIAYFITLRYSLNSAVTIVLAVTNFNLLVPKLKEYFSLIKH